MPVSSQSLEEPQIHRRVDVDSPGSESRRSLPEVIVGIDLGLTCTGVAFSTPNMKQPLFLQNWLGSTRALNNKVPTQCCYLAAKRRSIAWGFECPKPGSIERGMKVIDCFKLWLDTDFMERVFRERGESQLYDEEDVRTWFLDFLTALRKHISEYVPKELEKVGIMLHQWESTRVEYNFSYPTTWSGSKVIQKFEEIVAEAGFGDSGNHALSDKRHTVIVKLTEAEAAAVYTARSPQHQRGVSAATRTGDSLSESPIQRYKLQEGDIVLICDSGGGTTDVSVLKIDSIQQFGETDGEKEEIPYLTQLDFVDGEVIGSARIDSAFCAKAQKRLESIHREDDENPHFPGNAAYDMTRTSFQRIKTTFGTPLSVSEEILLRVPGLPKDFNHTEARIRNGKMIFSKEEFRDLFDAQINRIFNLIDRQLDRLKEITPSERVTHFVISGGLGSSQYVQDRIQDVYGPNGQQRRIMISEQPQLAVCLGLVIHRVLQVRFGYSMLSERFSRESYGILRWEQFGKEHRHGRVQKRRIGSNDYAVDLIYWFVKEGQPVKQKETQRQTFLRYIDPASPRVIWCEDIAMSRAPADRLPLSIDEGDARKVAEIEVILDSDSLEQAKRSTERQRRPHLWKSVKRDAWIEYDVCVFPAPSGLRFEIHVAGTGIKIEKEISVDWAYAPDPKERGSEKQSIGRYNNDTTGCLVGPILAGKSVDQGLGGSK